MAWALVTPSSRGIGFALTRHLLTYTNLPIIATARADLPSVKKSLLSGLSNVSENRLHVLRLDVTDEPSIAAAAKEAKSLMMTQPNSHLRLAFALPGILHPEKSPKQIDYTDALSTFKVNALGNLLLIKHFSDFLPRKSHDFSSSTPSNQKETQQESESKKNDERRIDGEHLPPHALYLTFSARVGSTSDNTTLGGWYSYRASKSAVYSLTKTFDLYLKTRSGEKAMAVCYHPGTVKTGLSEEFWEGAVKRRVMEVEKGESGDGKGKGLFEKEEAVEKLWGVVNRLGVEDRGRCWDWRGEEILP